MKDQLKRLGMIALVLAIAATAAGCGKASQKQAGKGQKMEVSVSMFDRGKVSTAEGSYTENRWTKWINEQTGINVTWIPVPRNESTQKLSTMIAAGQAPDIIWEFDRTFFTTLIEQGVIQPVDELVEKYSTTYKDYINTNSDLKQYISYDNKMYAAPCRRSMEATANHAMWIRQDWLDKLGLKVPATDEEAIEVAKAFAKNDPDGNGVADTYGFALMQWQEMLPALYQANVLWYLEDGKMKYGPTLDRYADYLDFFKKLYDQKLIDPEFFTDKTFQSQKQLWVTGKAGILTNNWQEQLNKELLANDPNAKPVPLEPFATKYGKNGQWQETVVSKYIMFNKDLKNPEAAVKMLDFMTTEKAWKTLLNGNEGEHYNNVDGIPVKIDADKFDREVAYANEYALLSLQDVKAEWYPKMAAQDERSQELARQRGAGLNNALKNKFRRDLPFDPITPEISKILTEFLPKRDEIRMKVVTGGAEFSPKWGMEQIKSEWARLGGAEAEAAADKWYEKNKGLFSK